MGSRGDEVGKNERSMPNCLIKLPFILEDNGEANVRDWKEK